MSIHLLPNELQNICLDYLPTEDLSQAASVHRAWHEYLGPVLESAQIRLELLREIGNTPLLANCLSFLSREELRQASLVSQLWRMGAREANQAQEENISTDTAFILANFERAYSNS